MTPYGLQDEILKHDARFKEVAFGRQSGKSWLAKRWLLEEAGNGGYRCWWVAPTLPTAQDHWQELLDLIEDSGLPVKAINRQTKTIRFLSDPLKSPTTCAAVRFNGLFWMKRPSWSKTFGLESCSRRSQPRAAR